MGERNYHKSPFHNCCALTHDAMTASSLTYSLMDFQVKVC